MHKKLKELEQKIGYRFRNFSFLEQAMMHSSYTNEHRMEKYICNERLEFLGDAVLEKTHILIVFLRLVLHLRVICRTDGVSDNKTF